MKDEDFKIGFFEDLALPWVFLGLVVWYTVKEGASRLLKKL